MSVWSIKYLLLHRDDLLSYHLLCREPLDSFWNLITRAKILRQSRRFVLQGCFGRLKSFFIFAGAVCENTSPDGKKKKPLCFPSRATYPCNPFYKVIKLLPKRWLGYLPFAGADQPFIHVQFPSSCHYCPLAWLFLFHLSACPVDVFTLVCLYLAFSPAFIGRFGLSVLSLWNLLLLFLCFGLEHSWGMLCTQFSHGLVQQGQCSPAATWSQDHFLLVGTHYWSISWPELDRAWRNLV